MRKRIFFSIAFLLIFALNVKAQNNSDYTWVPLKSLLIRRGTYNSDIPIYAVGLKKVEPVLRSNNLWKFSEKPNMEEGHYVVDASKLNIEIDSKENITEFDQLKDIGDGWKGIKFEKPLYLYHGNKNVSQNMIVCISKNDCAKMTGSNKSNDNSFSHLNTNLEKIASPNARKKASLFSLEKPHKDSPNQSKPEFTTPEAAGYTLLDTKTIAGFKCDYYLEGVRTFRFGNGDFMTFPDGKDDGLDKRKPSRNHLSLGDWQMTTDNGCVVKCQNGVAKVDFPSGVSISNKYSTKMNWEPDDAKPRISIVYYFGDQLYLPNQNTPLTFYNVNYKGNKAYNPFKTYGYLNDDRMYYVTEDGVAYPYKQKVNDYFISAIASDTIIKADLVIQNDGRNGGFVEATLQLEYSNGDNLNCVYSEYEGEYLIKSGTIHRNGGVLSIKEVNGRVVKVLTFPNGDKYAGEFRYGFVNRLKLGASNPDPDIFKLGDLSLPELQYWNGTLIKADGKKIVFEGGKTEQQRLAERQAQNAKTMAQYNQLCKQFGQKYVDAALAQTPIVGMPEKLLQAAFSLRLIESGTNYKMYRINGLGWKNFGRTLSDNVLLYTVWVRNGRVTDVRYWGN